MTAILLCQPLVAIRAATLLNLLSKKKKRNLTKAIMVRGNFTAKIMRVKLDNNYYWLHYNRRKLSNWLASACGLGLNSRPWHSCMFPVCMDFRSVNNINFCSDNVSEVPFISSQDCYPVFLMEHVRSWKWAWFIFQYFIKIKCSSNLVISNNISYIWTKSFTYTTYSYRWHCFFFFSSKLSHDHRSYEHNLSNCV